MKIRIIKISFCIIILLCISFVCIKVGKKLYHQFRPYETTVYGASEAEQEDTAIYNTKSISDAYLSEDPSTLSDFDKKIYDKAVEIIDNVIHEDMSLYEKELAIHDYIVSNSEYDTANLGIFHEHSQNSDNPYGVLINGKSICTGYATTFKMFMDMFEIPNIIVYAEDDNRDDHAWNMVQLDNDWYYVDVTWDDPVSDIEDLPVSHIYFNVTEEFLRNNRHVWNSEGLPKADSTEYSYETQQKMNGEN
ncbi:MAG: hypothetical protein K2F81_02260 [Ruminococcus sp.]|nr:hypothetical protein [Ruminococcus sp.]